MLTQDDFSKIGTLLEEKLEQKLEEKLKPIKKDLRMIRKDLSIAITQFDRQNNYHHRRLNQLEEKVGVLPPSYIHPIH